MILRFSSVAPSLSLALVFLLGGIAGCDRQNAPAAGSVTDSNLAEMIEQARTPAAHREIADYYETRASAARREEADQRELRGRYERRWRPEGHGMGSRASRHVEELAADHEQTANHYRGMADWHREMAQEGEHLSTPDE